ncbi:MAG: glycoside hydrolase family 44 protein [Myxococcales bacterium]
MSVALLALLLSADVVVRLDTSKDRRPISPYVYGYNAASAASAPPGATFLRLGGNRFTAYNWASNYSNAGSDYGPYHNDTYLGGPNKGPGFAVASAIADARARGLGLLVTIPIQGWVSRDESGNVDPKAPRAVHFARNEPRRGAPFTLAPDPDAAVVYQDEFANFCAKRWGEGGTPIAFSLDNEPDLWAYTHAEIQREPITYAALMAKSLEAAAAIKDAVPSSLVFGPASYGFNGFVNLQNARDARGRDFLDFYLKEMRAASRGRRLLDVLDVHFYSEAQGCGVRVTGTGPAGGDCAAAARMQAPRSLWDPSYRESSWITRCCTDRAGIELIPRLRKKIAAHFPGTRLAVTEYNPGGADQISGAIAQADTLGIFGREGVFAASYWPMGIDNRWAWAAWRAFRGYDGAGRNFGETSVAATSTDAVHVAAYASVDASAPGRVVLVLVHRPATVDDRTGEPIAAEAPRPRTVEIAVANAGALTARIWQLGPGASPEWKALPAAAPRDSTLSLVLPPLTVTTVELSPVASPAVAKPR